MRKRYNIVTDENDGEVLSPGSRKPRNSIHSVSVFVGFGTILTLLALYGAVYLFDGILPTPLYLSDEANHPQAFITERAHHDLRLLTDLGPRIAGGYENEVLAAEFLKREIGFITQQANRNQEIELDVQVVTGAYYMNEIPAWKLLAYSNVQNIVVKLHSRNNSASSLLISAHFDSVPTSPGGSDDGISCAVMLEMLRKLSREEQRPLHNIIFLFNGAEETGLQASHGFITQHKWAAESKVVINLEAAGAGGKAILFQSGPEAPWLMKYYNRVPHPYGQAAGEEIFQSNLIPSDTDYRIFRDYGGLIGFDTAFFKNGYRYHTKYDDFEHIPLGSFQHMGDNTLALVRDIANAPELAQPHLNPGKMVFFDVLGLFMISYTECTGCIINFVTAFLSLAIFVVSIQSFKLGYNLATLKYLAKTFGAILLGWVLSALFVGVTAFFVDLIGYSMSWYANPWLVLGLYVAPIIALSPILLPLIKHNNLSHNVKAQVQAHAVRLIWTLLLFIGTILQIRTMYAFLIPIMFNTLAFIIIHAFKLQHTIRKWQIIYVSSMILPTIFLMYTTITTLALFIPICGRIGSDKNADLIIGMMSFLFTLLITSPFLALASLVRNLQYVIAFLGGVFLISLIIIFTPLGFPYSGDTDSPAPERYWILHTRRVFHGENGEELKRDAGYFLLNMDRNSPSIVQSYVPDIERAKSLEEDCRNYLLCGLPLAHSKMIQIIKHSSWIPAGQPLLPEPTRLEVVSKINLSPNVIRYNISIQGPDRIGLYVSPKENIKIINISLLDEMPPEDRTEVWNGRPLYFGFHIYCKEAAPFALSFDVEVPANYSDVTTEIAVTGIYVHENKNRKVPHYVHFLNQFPDWADMTAWLGSFESWWI